MRCRTHGICITASQIRSDRIVTVDIVFKTSCSEPIYPDDVLREFSGNVTFHFPVVTVHCPQCGSLSDVTSRLVGGEQFHSLDAD